MNTQKYHIKDYYFWKISLSLAFASFFVFASMYIVQPLLPLYVREFKVSVSEATLTLSATIVGLIIGLIILGFFSDRIGRVAIIKYSLIGSVIPFLLIPMLDSFYLFVLLRFIQGFALAGLPAASLAYLNEEIDRSSVGIATALYIASNALGGMAGRVLAGYLTDIYAWETVFYIFAGGGLLIVGLVFIFLPKSRFFKASNLSFRKDLEGMIFHLKNPTIIMIIGMGAVLQLSFTSIWTYLPFHLEAEPFSLSTKAISYTFFAYGFGVIGAPIAGWLAGGMGLKVVRIIGILVLSTGILMTFSLSLPIIIIGLCVSCLGFFTAHSLTATFVAEEAAHHKGGASSLYLVAYYVGVTLGSSAVGPIWNIAGWNAIVGIAGILPVAYLVLVIVVQKNVR
ncbi:MFS transporter [Oceanobacillus profundus]|uniref:MFS transporter n=1 Tax=Oceanobacillus profundus TaxID=372463 RepID=A0A417Y9N6_9BACI|nr:MFS transporter [Oceanobacillus profundus]MDO6451539.1 MFS transporter [Oceanobacillus profundus]RHW29389.1 MFS transporter [Oceanobacillus profundus]